MRGRKPAQRILGNGRANGVAAASRHRAHRADSSAQSGGSRRNSPARVPDRAPFTLTRSRSPAVHANATGNGYGHLPHRTASPALFARTRHATPLRGMTLLPGTVNVHCKLPFRCTVWVLSLDVRQTTENVLLLCSLGYCAAKVRACSGDAFSPDSWASIGRSPVNT